MVILDTDHLSILEWKENPAALKLREKMSTIPAKEIGTTIVNFEEQVRGWMSYLADAKTIKEQIVGYRRLRRQLELYASVVLLDFDENAATEYQRLKKEKIRIGTMDLKISAIALVHRATIATANKKHFSKVPGLTVENWLV